MYRHCIFCSADLGANEALEAFPVGRAVAFDSARGRLWAVCRACGRWNLAPIEERWEPVEAAERQFRNARMRVQSENVGLARMADGTSLIRIGDALAGEFAAWRYGRQLLRRRVRWLVGGAAAMAGMGCVYFGLSAVGMLGGTSLALMGTSQGWELWRARRIIHLLDTGAGAGPPLAVRRWHVSGMNLQYSGIGEIGLVVRDLHRRPPFPSRQVRRTSRDVTVLYDSLARSVLTRAMVHVNTAGASKGKLAAASAVIDSVETPEALLPGYALRGWGLSALPGADALALEMVLNEEGERRAMEGELAALAAAWREAEAIAAIADRLPIDIDLSGVRRLGR